MGNTYKTNDLPEDILTQQQKALGLMSITNILLKAPKGQIRYENEDNTEAYIKGICTAPPLPTKKQTKTSTMALLGPGILHQLSMAGVQLKTVIEQLLCYLSFSPLKN